MEIFKPQRSPFDIENADTKKAIIASSMAQIIAADNRSPFEFVQAPDDNPIVVPVTGYSFGPVATLQNGKKAISHPSKRAGTSNSTGILSSYAYSLSC